MNGNEVVNKHLSACNRASNLLPAFESIFPNDARPRRAIELTRAWLLGEAPRKEVEAAGKAAWDANGAAWWHWYCEDVAGGNENGAWKAFKASWIAAKITTELSDLALSITEQRWPGDPDPIVWMGETPTVPTAGLKLFVKK